MNKVIVICILLIITGCVNTEKEPEPINWADSVKNETVRTWKGSHYDKIKKSLSTLTGLSIDIK